MCLVSARVVIPHGSANDRGRCVLYHGHGHGWGYVLTPDRAPAPHRASQGRARGDYRQNLRAHVPRQDRAPCCDRCRGYGQTRDGTW